MSGLSTHVLDLVTGRPAQGVRIVVCRLEGDERIVLADTATNSDGRVDGPLVAGPDMRAGLYEIAFHIGDYFGESTAAPTSRFLDVVPLRFGVSDPNLHYHVPLLVTPWAYSTYRGS